MKSEKRWGYLFVSPENDDRFGIENRIADNLSAHLSAVEDTPAFLPFDDIEPRQPEQTAPATVERTPIQAVDTPAVEPVAPVVNQQVADNTVRAERVATPRDGSRRRHEESEPLVFPNEIRVEKLDRYMEIPESTTRLLAIDRLENFELLKSKSRTRRDDLETVKEFIATAYGVDHDLIHNLEIAEIEKRFRLAMLTYRMGRSEVMGRDLEDEEKTLMINAVNQLVYQPNKPRRNEDIELLSRVYGFTQDELEKVSDWGMLPVNRARVLHLLSSRDVLRLDGLTEEGQFGRIVLTRALVERYLGYDVPTAHIERKMNLILVNVFAGEEKGNFGPVILTETKAAREVRSFLKRINENILAPAVDEPVIPGVNRQRQAVNEMVAGRRADREALNTLTFLMKGFYTERGLLSNPDTRSFTQNDLEDIKWAHFYNVYVGGDIGAISITRGGRQIRLNEALVGSVNSAGEEFVAKVEKEAKAVEGLRKLSKYMFEDANEPEKLSNGNVANLAETLDTNMQVLVNLKAAGSEMTVAHMIVKWDQFMRESRMDTVFGDMWNDRSVDVVCGPGASHQVKAIAKIARDIYFVTGGAARYECTKKKVKENSAGEWEVNEAEGSYKLASRGVIKFRDMYVYPLNATMGDVEQLKTQRKLLTKGIDLRFFSLWDETDRADNGLYFVDGYRPANAGRAISRIEANYEPLTLDKVIRVANEMSNPNRPLKLTKYMERTEKAWKTMKAEAALLRSGEADFSRAAKFKELMKEYGHLRGDERKDALAARLRAHLDYLSAIFRVPKSDRYLSFLGYKPNIDAYKGYDTKNSVMGAFIASYYNDIGPERFDAIVRDYGKGSGKFDLYFDEAHHRRQSLKKF